MRCNIKWENEIETEWMEEDGNTERGGSEWRSHKAKKTLFEYDTQVAKRTNAG